MTTDNTPTPLSQQAAEPIDEPSSLHVRVGGLEVRVTKVEKTLDEKLTSIDGNIAALAGVAKDPDFRRHLLSILGSVAIIASLAAAALAGRQSAPAAPAPAPAVTVVMPKEVPQ